MPKLKMRHFHYVWKESHEGEMSLKPAQLAEETIPKNCLSLQLMKNPAATADHKYPQSLQPVRINHEEKEQESLMDPL
jgi:hypothetical protein